MNQMKPIQPASPPEESSWKTEEAKAPTAAAHRADPAPNVTNIPFRTGLRAGDSAEYFGKG